MRKNTDPTAKPPRFHFSPSEYHRWLLDRTAPQLHFRGGDVVRWQRRLGRKLAELIGPMGSKEVPLRPRTLWKRRHALGTIQKIVFSSEPNVDIPAYLCLPDSSRPPFTCMICLQGHTSGMHNSIAVAQEDETRHIAVGGDRDFAVGCLQRGIAALCIEQRSFGLRREQIQKSISTYNSCHDAAMQALMLGRTLLGQRVYDVKRGIDYLLSRSDIDPRAIGVMGNSGGGTVSMYALALLPELAFGMPSCSFCTFRDSIMSVYHCSDNYVPGMLQWAESSDILGLAAPRPVVVVAGRDDPLFPIAGVRKAFAGLRAIYKESGVADQCRLVVGAGGHRFYAGDAWPVMLELIARVQ